MHRIIKLSPQPALSTHQHVSKTTQEIAKAWYFTTQSHHQTSSSSHPYPTYIRATLKYVFYATLFSLLLNLVYNLNDNIITINRERKSLIICLIWTERKYGYNTYVLSLPHSTTFTIYSTCRCIIYFTTHTRALRRIVCAVSAPLLLLLLYMICVLSRSDVWYQSWCCQTETATICLAFIARSSSLVNVSVCESERKYINQLFVFWLWQSVLLFFFSRTDDFCWHVVRNCGDDLERVCVREEASDFNFGLHFRS